MKKIFYSVVLVSLLLTILVLPVLAQDPNGWKETECKEAGHIWYNQMCIAEPPNLTLTIPVGDLVSGKIDIANYLKNLYQFGVAAASVLAIMMIIIGGFIWLTAGGSQEKVTTAKEFITGALMGLVLALGSYTILRVVNPSLVFFAPLKIPVPKTAFFADICPETVPANTVITCEGYLEGKALPEGTKIPCGYSCGVGEGADAKSCRGSWVDPGMLCLPNMMLDKNKNLKMDGLKPSTACENFSKINVKPLGLTADQSSCDVVNKYIREASPKQRATLPNNERGSCVWINDYWTVTIGSGCHLCDQQTYYEVSGIIENMMKAQNPPLSKSQACNAIGASSGWSDVQEACYFKWCFGYGGTDPTM